MKDELDDVDLVTVYTDVYNMRIKLERMKKPIGTRDSPARSCKDLHHGHPQLKDGTIIQPILTDLGGRGRLVW